MRRRELLEPPATVDLARRGTSRNAARLGNRGLISTAPHCSREAFVYE